VQDLNFFFQYREYTILTKYGRILRTDNAPMNTGGSLVRFANVRLLRQVRFAQYSTAHRSVTS
jgi:hypothetical protein